MDLAAALLQAVRAQDFGHTPDAWRSGQAVDAFPSIDLAVVSFGLPGASASASASAAAAAAFAPIRPPRFANVLFSREHPQGLVAQISAQADAVQNIRFDADQRDATLESPAWLPGADWQRLRWTHLHGTGRHRFVAPYPASLLKLMVAVGMGLAVDAGKTTWPLVATMLVPMITVSDNDATDACVALLHRLGLVDALNQRLAQLGLHTLQLNRTTRGGGWRNADGAGVGQIHMTAWDTVRLLWLLDADAPPAPWLPPHTALLQPATRDLLRAVLARQQLDEVLSSGALRAVPDWVPGLPDAPAFAHKTGTTQNYASDAGIVRSEGCHYLVAVLTSLGRRHAPHEACATTWRLTALGAAVHQIMERTP